MRMKLYTPEKREKGKRWYCGPFAFAAITGYTFEDTRAALNSVRGMPANTGVMGTSTGTMLQALRDAGFNPQLVSKYIFKDLTRTLNQWLKEQDKADESIYLVEVTDHWIVVQGRSKMIDNHTGHPVAAFAGPWQRKQVKEVYRIR